MTEIKDFSLSEPPKIPMPIDPDILNPYKECKCGCENAIYPPCKKCGKSHGMGIKYSKTGHIEPIDLCYSCLWSDFKFIPQIDITHPSFCQACEKNIRIKDEYGWYCTECKEY